MIRSEVGVTARTPLAAVIACAREPSRVALTDCFECLLADRDVFCFVVITSPLGAGRMEVNSISSQGYKSTLLKPMAP